MAEGNKSQLILKQGQEGDFNQNFSQFYRLHYQPKHSNSISKRESIGFRAKSVNTIVPARNPEEQANQAYMKHKKSLKEKIKERQRLKLKDEKNKAQKFSYRQALSKQIKNDEIQQYFNRFPIKEQSELQQLSRRNIGVKLALQKCKDEKMKIQKVISSTKQSQETKLDYLDLKKKDIQEEIKGEIKLIYEEFFKKQYQIQGQRGYDHFQKKIRTAMEILHKQLFSSK